MTYTDKLLTPGTHADTLTADDAMRCLARLYPHRDEACELTLVCRPGEYSASLIARAVEDCDAHLINLNVTDDPDDIGHVTVELRVGQRTGYAVARSLARYGYEVTDIRGADRDVEHEVARDRVNELIRILEQ